MSAKVSRSPGPRVCSVPPATAVGGQGGEGFVHCVSDTESSVLVSPWPFSASVSPLRAKEIKIKLGTLLQKPDPAADLVIPYNEKPEKPAKTQK